MKFWPSSTLPALLRRWMFVTDVASREFWHVRGHAKVAYKWGQVVVDKGRVAKGSQLGSYSVPGISPADELKNSKICKQGCAQSEPFEWKEKDLSRL